MSTLTLLPDEQIVFRRRPHLFVLLWLLFLLFVVFLLYVTFFCPLAVTTSLDGRCFPLAALALFLTGFLVYLDWWSTRYTLTTRRVVRERGVIGRQLIEIELRDIENVTIKQDIPGRIFGYGTLLVESAGVQGQVRWVGIAAPLQVRHEVLQAVSAAKHHAPPGK